VTNEVSQDVEPGGFSFGLFVCLFVCHSSTFSRKLDPRSSSFATFNLHHVRFPFNLR
jgi:hypothetical protein